MGMNMEEYGTSSMHYSASTNTLRLFGEATRDGCTDSMLFMTETGGNTKYLFRQYHDFLSA
jgi:hypothetical protein